MVGAETRVNARIALPLIAPYVLNEQGSFALPLVALYVLNGQGSPRCPTWQAFVLFCRSVIVFVSECAMAYALVYLGR